MIRPLLLALALTAVVGPASAQTTSASGPAPDSSSPASPAVPAPASPDAAAKRGITLAQFLARREKAYMAADTDGDGKISQAEWMAFSAKRKAKGDPAKLFARIDTNHDGFIDHDELEAFLTKRFARLDKNHDGVLTPDELPGHKSASEQEQ